MAVGQIERYDRITRVVTELWENLYDLFWKTFWCLPTVVIYYPHGIYRQHAKPIQLIEENREKIKHILASQYRRDPSSINKAISGIKRYKNLRRPQGISWSFGELSKKHFDQLEALKEVGLKEIDPVLLLDVLKAFPLRSFPLEQAIRQALQDAVEQGNKLKTNMDVMLRYSEEDPKLNGIRLIQNGVIQRNWGGRRFSLEKADNLFELYNFLERTLLLFDSPMQRVTCLYLLPINDRGTYRGNAALIRVHGGRKGTRIDPGYEQEFLESFYHNVNRWVSEIGTAMEFEAQSHLREQAPRYLSGSPEQKTEILSESISFIQEVKRRRNGNRIIFSYIDFPHLIRVNLSTSGFELEHDHYNDIRFETKWHQLDRLRLALEEEVRNLKLIKDLESERVLVTKHRAVLANTLHNLRRHLSLALPDEALQEFFWRKERYVRVLSESLPSSEAATVENIMDLIRQFIDLKLPIDRTFSWERVKLEGEDLICITIVGAVEEILENLFSNSIRHSMMGNDLEVSIKISASEESILIDYSDNGKGFDFKSREKVSDWLEGKLLPDEAKEQKGIGIRSIGTAVDILNARIVHRENPIKKAMDTKANIPVMFSICLPLKCPEEWKKAEASEKEAQKIRKEFYTGTGLIVFIDMVGQGDSFRKFFERTGYEFKRVNSVEEAIKAIKDSNQNTYALLWHLGSAKFRQVIPSSEDLPEIFKIFGQECDNLLPKNDFRFAVSGGEDYRNRAEEADWFRIVTDWAGLIRIFKVKPSEELPFIASKKRHEYLGLFNQSLNHLKSLKKLKEESTILEFEETIYFIRSEITNEALDRFFLDLTYLWDHAKNLKQDIDSLPFEQMGNRFEELRDLLSQLPEKVTLGTRTSVLQTCLKIRTIMEDLFNFTRIVGSTGKEALNVR